MCNAIFFFVIITSLYYQNQGIDNRTQLKNGKKYLNYPKKKITVIQLQPKASMPANILDFSQKQAMYYVPKTQQLGPEDKN